MKKPYIVLQVGHTQPPGSSTASGGTPKTVAFSRTASTMMSCATFSAYAKAGPPVLWSSVPDDNGTPKSHSL